MPRKKNSRAAAGAGTIRQRPDGLWEARATVGKDPGTDKPVRRSVYGRTQAEVREKLTEITSQVDHGTYTKPSRMRLRAWLEIWTQDYLCGVKASTVKLYADYVRLYIAPALGATRLEELKQHDLQRFFNGLAARLSPKTVKNISGVLHAALDVAVCAKYIAGNPVTGCKLPKREKPDIKPMSEEEQMAFLQAVKGHKHELLYQIALFTGLRESELLGLTWDNVDFKKGTITVKQQLRKDQRKGGGYYMTSLKMSSSANAKTRKIMPAPFVMHLLKEQQIKTLEMRFKAGELWTDKVELDGHEYDLVFRNDDGGLLSYRTVYDCFKRIVAKIGIPETRFHDLRHTFAVNSIRAGDDWKTISENLGHTDVAFTINTYGHFVDSMRQDSAARQESFISALFG